MKRLAIIFLILMLATPALAQVDYWQLLEPVVNDVRASAMGRCELFGSRDASAMFSNPAWMGATRDLSIEVGMGTRFGDVEFENPEEFGLNNFERNYTGKMAANFAAAALPLRLKGFPISFGAGIGIWTMHEAGWDNETSYGDETDMYTITREYTNPLQVAGIGLSAGIFDMIYAGISTGSSTGSETEFTETYTNESPLETLTSTSTYRATPSFTVATASLVLRPSQKFKIGLMARPAYDIELTDAASGDSDNPTPMPDITISVPATTGISVSLTPDKLIEFVVEYQSRNYNGSTIEANGVEIVEFDVEDGTALRAGAKLGVFHVGYFQEDLPLTEWGEETPQSREGWTFGLGHRGDRFSLHIAAELATHKYETSGLSSELQDVTEKTWRIGVGLGVHLF